MPDRWIALSSTVSMSARGRTLSTLAAALALAGCGDPQARDIDAAPADVDAGDDGPADGAVDADPAAIVAPVGTWTWIPVDGSTCGSGARAGVGINPSGGGDELVVFFQGGGACWNQGTCVPSLLSYGPVCYYNPNLCAYDGPGGLQPTAAHVAEADPFPASGLGNFPAELRAIERSTFFDRADPANPLRAASYVYVPYCTGDLHAGDAERDYAFKYNPFDPVGSYRMHFTGARNVRAYLARLVATYPAARKVWIIGVSGGGYGAQLNLERIQQAFPTAEVHVLADSAPLVPTNHLTAWTTAWNLAPPAGCTDCDQGLPAWIRRLMTAHPTSRFGLMSYDRDRVISWFFFAGDGPDQALSPPLDTFRAALLALRTSSYAGRANARTFVVPGEAHVFLGDYENRAADGTVRPPITAANGVDLREFVVGWATGAGWASGE